jgi:hypothetical protein
MTMPAKADCKTPALRTDQLARCHAGEPAEQPAGDEQVRKPPIDQP